MRKEAAAELESKIDSQKGSIDQLREDHNALYQKVGSIKDLLSPKMVKMLQDPNLYEFPLKGLKIRIEHKNSKDTILIHSSKPCWTDGRPDFVVKFPFDEKFVKYRYDGGGKHGGSMINENVSEAESLKKFIKTMMDTNCLVEIDANTAFTFYVDKPGSSTWEEVIPKIKDAICSIFPDVEKTEEKKETTKLCFIGEIEVDQSNKPVYYREDGSTWIKLSYESHAPAMFDQNDKKWLEHGTAEPLVGSELVKLIVVEEQVETEVSAV